MMNVDPWVLATILSMAAVTYFTRIVGAAALANMRPGPRLKAALDAVPVAVLTAVIAPSVAAGGPPDWIAAAITIVAALRLPLLATFVVGIASVVLLRSMLG